MGARSSAGARRAHREAAMIKNGRRRFSCALVVLLLAACHGCSAPTPREGVGSSNAAPPRQPSEPGLFLSPPLAGLDNPAGRAGAPAAAEPLAPFFRRLAELEHGRGQGPLTIIQFGDSHTAGESFTAHLRARFQARFGSAGRGMLPPGVPFRAYHPQLVKITQSAGWTALSSFDAGSTAAFGMTGFRSEAHQAGAVMALEADEGTPGGGLAALEALMQPGGGSLEVRAPGLPPRTLTTAASAPQAALLLLPLPPGPARMEVAVRGDGPVDLLAWGLERRGPGIVFDSYGINGTTVGILDRWDGTAMAFELQWRAPSLIIVAFGTNEGWNDNLDRERYAREFAGELGRLRALAPRAALLVLGPPDGNRRAAACGARQGRASCTPASGTCSWAPPPSLAVVRDVQRRVAAASGAAFWDWSGPMGGECGIHDWATRSPPLAYADHVHLSKEGYELTADALFDTLMRQYAEFLRSAPVSSLEGTVVGMTP